MDDGGVLIHPCGNETFAEYSRFPPWSLNVGAVTTIIIITVGILGNSLAAIALSVSKEVRSVATTFIISLCVADFLFCLLALPFSASQFIHGDWIHGRHLCTYFPLVRYANTGVSVLSLTMVTINRLIGITNHKWYPKLYTTVGICCMIAFCWIFTLIMHLPTLLGIWGKFDYDPLLKTCTIVQDDNKLSSKSTLIIMSFVIPSVAIILCYIRIFWVVRRSNATIKNHSVTWDMIEAKRREQEWRITIMIFVIFIAFCVCFLPITVVKVADKCVNYPVAHVFAYILWYMSACVNPIIYVFMNQEYRKAFKSVLCSSTLCRIRASDI